MAKGDKYAQVAEKFFRDAASVKLRVSFAHVDWDAQGYFFLHGLDKEYYVKLCECIAELQRATEDEIVRQNHKSLKPSSIFNTKLSIRSEFPPAIVDAVASSLRVERPDPKDQAAVLEDARKAVGRAFEIRLGTNWGRIHGFVWDKVFHIVWFDPAHNLYPGSGNKPRDQASSEYAVVRCFSPAAVDEIREANQKLVDEKNQLIQEKLNIQRELDELYVEFADRPAS